MKDEAATETRVRIYNQLKTKSIHSDEKAIKRIHNQLYYWLRSDIVVIAETDLWENVWMIVKGNVQQVRFVGKSSSPNFVSNIKWIWVNWLTSIPPEAKFDDAV